jgi:hypothetical protein
MALYTRRQLLVILLLVATAGGGLALGHWRRANSDTVEYLERLDRAPEPAGVSAPQPPALLRAVRSTADGEPRRARRGRLPRGAQVGPAARTPTPPPADDPDTDPVPDAASTPR